MNLFYQTFLLILFLVYFFWFKVKPHNELIIGVLSSRENFMRRSIIRKGLRHQLANMSYKIVFIIANTPCHVPFEYRVDPYTCDEISHTDEGFNYQLTDNIHVAHDIERYIGVGSVGKDLLVLHDILLTSLAVYDHHLDGFHNPLQITLYDMETLQPIVSTAFVSFSPGDLQGSYRFKTLNKPVLLKHGFKGSLVITGVTESDPLFIPNNCSSFYDNNKLVRFDPGYRYDFGMDNFPKYKVSNTRSPCYLSGLMMNISLYNYVTVDSNRDFKDIPKMSLRRLRRLEDIFEKSLRSHVRSNTTLLWYHKLDEQQKMLDKEQQLNNDLIFVDTMETYRNLPMKMLLFYTWLATSHNFDYFLKTDDDTFVNITSISNYLKHLSLHHHMKNVWLGNFREYFPLDLQGKWREHDYKASSYPPFACGSGYLLSSNIVRWISQNRNFFKAYQGEDTSLGIWLSSLDNINRVHHIDFKCGHSSRKDVFTSPEHNLTELTEMYDNG